jgi:hypothetical protein
MNEASNRSTAAPWAWRPSKNAWFRGLLVPITAWRPDPALELDGSALVRRLCEAAEGNEEWLFHPLINPLVLAHGQRLSSDFQLAVWIAGHSSTSLGSVRVPQPLWTWSPDGGVAVPPGLHDLDSLASATAKSSWPFDIALDVWSDSIGFPYPTNFSYPNDWSWSAHRPLSDARRGRLETEVRIFMSAVNGLSSALPECIEWTATVTRVVVPLCRDVDTKFKSGSRTDLPGVVFFDLHGGAHQICEALVHESAHQHLCIEEAAGPLVEPAHQGTYSSPLRPDPRPLRGILLAYHALVYMCLYYAECIGRGIGHGQEDELEGLRRKTDDGERVLADNARNLTPAGVAFFERTREVRRHVVA